MAKKKKRINAVKDQQVVSVQKQQPQQSKENQTNKFTAQLPVIAAAVVLVFGIVIRIIMYTKDRSLWLDEAMLAVNVSGRSWLDLLVPPLDHSQSAPALYVATLKLFGAIFGYNEFAMRFFSLLSFFGFVICFALLLKKAFGLNNIKASAAAALSALIPNYIWYSNEVKPYMGDAFFAVLTILLYVLYREKKIKLPVLTALYILFLGFSSPVIFFIGGTLSCEFIAVCIKRDKKQIIKIFAAGTAVVMVFGIYYLWWLSPAREFMQSYWGDGTTSWGERFNLIRGIFKSTAIPASDATFLWGFVPFSLAGVFFACRSKNVAAIASVMSLAFVIVASYIGMWPANERLWLFLPAFVLIFAVVAVDAIGKLNKIAGIVGVAAMWIVIVALSYDSLNFAGERAYMQNQEINPPIYYLRENVRDDDVVYLYEASVHAFDFKNNFSRRIGDVAQDNVFVIVDDKINSVIQHNRVYMIFTHFHRLNQDIFPALNFFGNLTMVMDVHDTPLVLFERHEDWINRVIAWLEYQKEQEATLENE